MSDTSGRFLFQSHSFDDASVKFNLVECLESKIVRTEPVPSQRELSEYYSTEYYGSSAVKFNGFMESLPRWASRRTARKTSSLARSARTIGRSLNVLDVGCGRGEFLREFSRVGAKCTGIDIADFRFIHVPGKIEFFQGDLLTSPFIDGSFDVISFWHVLEHLPEPEKIIAKSMKLLRAGGVLAIEVPNFDSFQARCFRSEWFHLD